MTVQDVPVGKTKQTNKQNPESRCFHAPVSLNQSESLFAVRFHIDPRESVWAENVFVKKKNLFLFTGCREKKKKNTSMENRDEDNYMTNLYNPFS